MENKARPKPGRRSHRTDPVLKLKSIFFSSVKSEKMPVISIISCMVLTTTIGILTVYFTVSGPRTICERAFKRTMKSSLIFSSQPRSVVTSDINNDHQMDFIVANSGTDTIGVFIAQGNESFTNQQTYSTGSGSNPHSLAINDFNNDSYADIVVANYATNNIGLFLGYGNGTLHDQKVIPLGSSHPLFVSTGDLNKDKHMDIAIVNNGTDTISILLGYGNGSFQDQTTYSTGYDSFPSSLATGDFNNDTYLDLVVANSGTNNIGIFLNYGNGTFTNQHSYTTMHNSKPSSVAVEDVNNDNRLDIVIANHDTGNVGILFGHGNGTFLSQRSYAIGSKVYPKYVTVRDMNKDNRLDLVIVNSENDQIHVVSGDGNGSFGAISTYDGVVGSMPIWITVCDFNKNNKSDAVVVNYGTNNVVVLMDYFSKTSVRQQNYHVAKSGTLYTIAVNDFNDDGILDIVGGVENYISILIGVGNYSFDKPVNYSMRAESLSYYMCIGDVNNDNRMDIITADNGLNAVGVLLGYGNGSFDTMTTYSTGIDSHPFWVALGDFNDDNVLDIVSANHGTNSIGILLGNGNGSFTLTTNYSIDSPVAITVYDINNDNHLDIAVVSGNDKLIIFVGQGNCTFISMLTNSTGVGAGPSSVFLADFNEDNHVDIVIANTFKDNVGILLGYGNGTFGLQTIYPTGAGSIPNYVIVGDFNNDNIADIAATNTGSSVLIIFYGYGNGSFQVRSNYSTGSGSKPWGFATADLDNDTQLEFVVALYGTGDIAILTEYNAAEFDHQRVYSTGSAPQPTSVALGDFNNDNRLDIVVANSGKDSLGIFLASNNGTFGMEIKYPIGTDFDPRYVITCDINKDNHIDIVSVNSKSDSISVIVGYGNGSFAEQIIYPTGNKSYPYAVVAGDLNNDNRLDLVVANKGTHNIGILYGYDYASFQSQKTYSSINNLSPAAIVVNDLNNDNILDIAAAFFDSDSCCILFGYGNGSFTVAKTYSLASGSYPVAIGAGDFNNDNQSDIVIINLLAGNIGILLGYDNGNFGNITLYSTGNDSRPIAVAFGDFNKDSRLDIVVANYRSGNIGVFLSYGNGSFATIMTYSTGPASRPNALAVADFNNDGQLDVAAANLGTNNVGVLLGYGNGTFATQVTFLSGYRAWPAWITVGDFNKDNQLDMAVANYNTQNVGILLGYGNGSFASAKTYSTGIDSQPSCLGIGDFNNDNILDIAVANYGSNTIVVLFGFGDEDGSFLLGLPYSTGNASFPYVLANGDFNGDGRLDIAVANMQSSTVGIFLGDDSQPFGGVTIYPVVAESKPNSVALGHFNNDSWLDIAVANYGTDNVGVLLGRNGRDFEDIQIYSMRDGSAPYSVAVADFNNDTYLDMVVSNSETDNIVILLGNGIGNFTSNATYSTGTKSRPYQVTIGDFNNDNIHDIAVANSGTSNIRLLHGYRNGTFENEISYPFGYGYQPYSIAVGHLNEDDRVDMAIACYGTDHIETLIRIC